MRSELLMHVELAMAQGHRPLPCLLLFTHSDVASCIIDSSPTLRTRIRYEDGKSRLGFEPASPFRAFGTDDIVYEEEGKNRVWI